MYHSSLFISNKKLGIGSSFLICAVLCLCLPFSMQFFLAMHWPGYRNFLPGFRVSHRNSLVCVSVGRGEFEASSSTVLLGWSFSPYFVISFENMKCQTSNHVLFQDCLALLSSLQLHTNFKTSLSVIAKYAT